MSGRKRDPVRDELDFYLEERTREFIEAGIDPAAARRRAEEAFGPRSGVERELKAIRRRRERRTRWAGLGSTLRQSLRSLRRHPAHAALVMGTLAVGVGATTAIFSVVDAVLIEKPPFLEPHRLVTINESDARRPHRNPAPADFLEIRRDLDVFSSVSAYDGRTANLIGTGQPENIHFADVSADFFHTLGVNAQLGRVFGPETVADGERLAVLSHPFWLRRFGGDPDAVGQTLQLDQHSYLIVGVMAEEIAFPYGVDLWTAATHDIPGAGFGTFDLREMRDVWYHRVIARLAPGIAPEVASDALAATSSEWASRFPASHADARVWLASFQDERVRDVRASLLLLLGATGLVLLIVCVNVANLVLVQAAGRAREWAVRRSLGAPRGRIVLQVVAESLVVAVGGAVGGIALAWLGVGATRSRIVSELPAGTIVDLDLGVLAFSVLLAVTAALTFGTLPVWAAASDKRGLSVDRGAGSGTASGRDRSVREGLVAVEVSLAVVLVLASGLLLRSLWALNDVDLGFVPDGIAAAWVGLPGAGSTSSMEVQAFYREVGERVGDLPGVEAASWTMRGPLSLGPGAGLRVRGVTDGNADLVSSRWQVVSPEYFEVAGIPLRSGRTFRRADDADGERVGVVNETLARRFFPDGGALGSLVNTGLDGWDDDEPLWVRIVGIMGDTKNRGPGGEPEPVLFRPMAQPTQGFRGDGALLTVRLSGDTPGFGAGLEQAVRSVNGDAPVGAIIRGDELATGYLSRQELVLTLLGTFAGIALTLGAVGIYGIARYAVLVRAREIGVRIALGARREQVTALVLRQGLRPALSGIAAGLLVSLGAVRLLAAQLYEVGTLDPLTWAVVPLLLLAVAALATWLPARRAAAVDPVTSIRGE